MGNTTSTTGGWSTPSEPPAKTSGEPEFVGGRWTTNEEDLTANPQAKPAGFDANEATYEAPGSVLTRRVSATLTEAGRSISTAAEKMYAALTPKDLAAMIDPVAEAAISISGFTDIDAPVHGEAGHTVFFVVAAGVLATRDGAPTTVHKRFSDFIALDDALRPLVPSLPSLPHKFTPAPRPLHTDALKAQRTAALEAYLRTAFALCRRVHGSALPRPFATFLGLSPLKLHVYDHCPFCTRAVLALGRAGVPYEKVVWGFGVGADPKESAGRGYDVGEGPAALTTKKELPVLEGAGVPAPAGFAGLPESLEIVSYAASLAGGAARLAPATGRADVDAWKKKLIPLIPKLVRPRLFQMPTDDWKDPRDVEYAARNSGAILAQYSGAIA